MYAIQRCDKTSYLNIYIFHFYNSFDIYIVKGERENERGRKMERETEIRREW